MQEKTLEKEFEEKFGDYFRRNNDEVGYSLLKSFISSREDKAREEGRLMAHFESLIHAGAAEKIKEQVITQYKEELLSKLPKELDYRREYPRWGETMRALKNMEELGFNECLSQIKKLLC